MCGVHGFVLEGSTMCGVSVWCILKGSTMGGVSMWCVSKGSTMCDC